MAFRPQLTVDVEYEGATFTFKTPDEAMSKVFAITQRCQAEGMDAAAIDAQPPADLMQAMTQVFVDGVIAWEGVEGEESFIACNGGTKRAIPFEDKVAVANGYLQKRAELQAGKVVSAAPGMSITEPEAPAESSTKATNSPASATPPAAETVAEA